MLNEPNGSKFVTRKWNFANDQSNANYNVGNELIFDTEDLISHLCEDSNAYILLKGDIAIIRHQITQVAFKNCASFTYCITKIDGTTIDQAEDLDLAMPMYNLIEHSSNYSETKGSSLIYYKDQAANFNADIANDNNFKSFEYKVKLLGNTVTYDANGILKNETVPAPLKYLINFWGSRAMPLINCKVELKLKWTKYCVLSAASADNINANSNNIIFTIKDTKLYVPVITLSARGIRKLSNFLSKGSVRSVCWDEYKTKSENKNTTNEYRYFLKSNFVGVTRLFVLVYSNQDANSKRFKI